MPSFRLPVWALAWIAVVLAALVILLSNQPAVDRILVATGLEAVLYPQGKAPPALVQPTPSAVSVLVEPTLSPTTTPAAFGSSSDAEVVPVVEGPAVPEPPMPTTPNTYRLYFLKLSPDGRLEPSAFIRELPAGLTPLAATLRALLLGPTLQDKAQGALTMVPEGTKMLSLRIRDRTALISLSDEFEHNTSGLEGLAGQLKEVVWTATQFSSVDSVQILINGQARETLGDEALPISSPLTRKTVP